MKLELPYLDVIIAILLSVTTIAGGLGALGVVRMTNRVEVKHPLNRRMGLFCFLFGLGSLSTDISQCLDLDTSLPALGWAILIVGALLMLVGIWIGLRTTKQTIELDE